MTTDQVKMQRGIVKFYNSSKGFGFIVRAGGSDSDEGDVFFHISRCGGYVPSDGDPVEYFLGRDRHGRHFAENVRSALAAAAE